MPAAASTATSFDTRLMIRILLSSHGDTQHPRHTPHYPQTAPKNVPPSVQQTPNAGRKSMHRCTGAHPRIGLRPPNPRNPWIEPRRQPQISARTAPRTTAQRFPNALQTPPEQRKGGARPKPAPPCHSQTPGMRAHAFRRRIQRTPRNQTAHALHTQPPSLAQVAQPGTGSRRSQPVPRNAFAVPSHAHDRRYFAATRREVVRP